MPTLPEAFVRSLKLDHPAEADGLLQILETDAPVSVRFNKNKSRQTSLPDPVAWNGLATYLKDRPAFTFDPLFHAGMYYVQEAASMIIGRVVQELGLHQEPLLALDLCAAPGGKSTLLLDSLHPESFLLANEMHPKRAHILEENVSKWGRMNVAVSNHRVNSLNKLGSVFDLILVDAPCSGEGLFRKNPEAVNEWSPGNVEKCAVRQRDILNNAIDLLKPGGHLIYSTCTYNKKENTEQIAWLQDEHGLQTQSLNGFDAYGTVAIDGLGYQCFPHRLRGEGLFFSALRKPDDTTSFVHKKRAKRKFEPLSASRLQLLPHLTTPSLEEICQFEDDIVQIPKRWLTILNDMAEIIRLKKIGTRIGTFKHQQFIPHHDWALSSNPNADFPRVEVDHETAILYLRRQSVQIPGNPGGWFVVCFKGSVLGWAKGIGNRVNNYYPKAYRIRRM